MTRVSTRQQDVLGTVSPNGKSSIGVRSMTELLADPPAAPPRLLEPALIVEGGLSALAAPTKVGKTNFWMHVAWALTDGQALFGRFACSRAVRVLMIQLELSEATMYERLELLRAELGWSVEGQDNFFVRCDRALLLDRRGGPERLIQIIEDCPQQPDVVILDSYNAAVAGDPDKSSDARRALHALRTVQEQIPVTWCITSEIRKAPVGMRLRFGIDDLKGSNELAYDADAILVLRPLDEARRRLAVHFLAMRHLAEEAPEGLVLVRKGLTFELTEGGGDELEEAVLEVLRDHLAAGGDSTWRACIDAVRESGLKVRDQVIGQVRRRLLKAER